MCVADYLPQGRSSSISVAVKMLFDRNLQESVLKEFSVMASTMHPNIVRLYGLVMDSTTVGPTIVMEYLPYGDLKTYLKVKFSKMKKIIIFPLIMQQASAKKPVRTLVKYMIDISMGMHYIAQKGLIHRVKDPLVLCKRLAK